MRIFVLTAKPRGDYTAECGKMYSNFFILCIAYRKLNENSATNADLAQRLLRERKNKPVENQ